MKASLVVGATKTIAICSLAVTAFVHPAAAEARHYIPLTTYRTGPFSGSGTPTANGMHDFFDDAKCS